MIRVDNLTVLFGNTVALEDIDLELGPGLVGLFGPNASGKSTLLRALAGLQRPTRGSVTIGRTAVAKLSEQERGRIGFAGHANGLYRELTVEENLRLFGSLYGTAMARVTEILDQLHLGDAAATPVDQLSAGLKRRVAVARALLHEPDVLLLDEPYANLDDSASEIVSDAIRSWWRPGRAGVVATHGAKRVKRYADAGVVLGRGRVVAHRAYSELEVAT